MPNKALIDSSFLFALYNQSDQNYGKSQLLSTNYSGVFIIPDVTLPEVTFLFARQGKTPAVIRFLKALAAAQPILEPLTVLDVQRAHEIMEKYAEAKLDFVDCSIMALSERLNITQICTFDRRDFPIFRPTHCEYLELLP